MAFFPASLADFGHGSMTLGDGTKALGNRPLMALLVDWDSNPSKIASFHGLGYYEQLAFGNPAPPFSTADPINPASLSAYFQENSLGRFGFTRVGLFEVTMGSTVPDGVPSKRCRQVLETFPPNMLAQHNVDADAVLEESELSIVMVENFAGALPGIAFNEAFTLTGSTVPFLPDGIQIRIRLAGGGPLTPFYQLAHEASHLLRTIDMYNMGQQPNNGNVLMTLMSSFSFTSDDQVVVHLDMWHKMQLGWAEPRRFALKSQRSEDVRDDTADGAIILWDETRRDSEYFLVERRRSDGPARRYDADFPGDGVCVWRVQKSTPNGPIVQNLRPPDLLAGVQGVWQVGQETPPLVWSDGTTTNVTLKFAAAPDGRVRVSWGEALTHASSVRHLRLFHGGNGSDGVGGLTRQGIFFGVTTEGNLEWNRYNGQGEQAGDPLALQSWSPNTGNLIGRGFAHLKQVVGAGDGVILVVHPDGTLRWFGYDGNGEPDITGAAGFVPNSGNTIRSGFENVTKMFVAPRIGIGIHGFNIFTVETDGFLRWYRYTGNGEHDPAGTTGWHPNSGNIVGQGWQGVRLVYASANVFFVVTDDNLLRWYSYSGNGEEDPSGVLGWAANTSNPIGRGFGDIVHLFGGVTNQGGFGHSMFAVNRAGDLRWFHYRGQGERDETGASGFIARSGNVIGTGW